MNDTPIRSPLSERDFPEATRAALRAMLLEQVSAAAGAARPARSRKPLLISAAVGVALIGVGGGAAYSALGGNGPVTDRDTARCYTTAAYTAGNDFPGTTIGVPDSASGPGAVADALDACGALWRAGILRPGVRVAVGSPPQARYPVPHLVECLLPDGRGAVFPGETGLCAQLGLQSAQTGTGR